MNSLAQQEDPMVDWHQSIARCMEGEMRRIRLLLERQVLWLRVRWNREGRGPAANKVIREDEADRLVSGIGLKADTRFLREHPEARRINESLAVIDDELTDVRQGHAEKNRPLPIDSLSRMFHLGDFERNVILLCLGAEIDPTLRRLYGYVQDDISRLRATPYLAIMLFASDERSVSAAWQSFQANSPLWYFCLIDSRDGDTGLLRSISLPERITEYLLGCNGLDPDLMSKLGAIEAAPLAPQEQLRVDSLELWAKQQISQGTAPRLNLTGHPGSGRRAVARELCERLGFHLYSIDLASPTDANSDVLPVLARETVLMQLALYIEADHADSAGEASTLGLLDDYLRRVPMPVFVGSRQPCNTSITLTLHEVSRPSANEQILMWEHALSGASAQITSDIPKLVEQFRFGPSGIQTAIDQAKMNAQLRDPRSEGISNSELWRACHERASRDLGNLAQQLEPQFTWDDIILPDDAITQLREISAQVAHRTLVYREWGFGAKLNRGRGITVLFAGPSGTGKTMAAEVLAGHLELALYRIDLSGVISKYIGETEKNLRKVFDAAEQSGAILFFDEADALFGKRTEVKDSHDRYANIEIDYLLQRMEDYRGLAILATNVKAHMDQAFLRRLRFLVDFPFPDFQHRLLIWQKVFPEKADVDDLDFPSLGRMEITGSNIKNIAINAAFMAADAGTSIGEAHVTAAAKREYAKLDRLMSEVNRRYANTSTESLRELEVKV